MFSIPSTPLPPGLRAVHDDGKFVLALTLQRLAELDRLRVIGLAQAERLAVATDGLSPQDALRRLVGSKGALQEFERVAKAVRQVVVLEFELRGLFKAPDRDAAFRPRLGGFRFDDLNDLDDYDDYDDLFDFEKARRSLIDLTDLRVRLDYDKGPLDALVADIRDILGAETPPDDPFARSAGEARANAVMDRIGGIFAGRKSASVAAADTPPRRPAMQAKPTAKAAAPALPRKGFRVPPTSRHNPNTLSRKQRNRGPPK